MPKKPAGTRLEQTIVPTCTYDRHSARAWLGSASAEDLNARWRADASALRIDYRLHAVEIDNRSIMVCLVRNSRACYR